MQIFVDTADINEITELVELGFIEGVTTNPSLLASRGLDEQFISEICNLVRGPVSIEVTEDKYESIIAQAKDLSQISENVVIKLPMGAESLKICSQLSKEEIKINMTLCFSVNQALLAAKAGANFISIFVGRLDDLGYNGIEVIRDTAEIFQYYNYQSLILAASIRSPLHFTQSLQAGAHIITAPPKILKQLPENPLTTVGINKFLSDWEKTRQAPLKNLL